MKNVGLGLGFGFVVFKYFLKKVIMSGDLPAIGVCTMCMQCLRRNEKEFTSSTAVNTWL